MKQTNEQARIASLAAAVSWAYHTTNDPKIRKTLKQVIRWHMSCQAEKYAEASR